MAFITHLVRGDHLIWEPSPHDGRVYIVVTRVARDDSWADLRMYTFASTWTKRMPMPMPMRNVRFDAWDAVDLARDAENACKGGAARHGFNAAVRVTE